MAHPASHRGWDRGKREEQWISTCLSQGISLVRVRASCKIEE